MPNPRAQPQRRPQPQSTLAHRRSEPSATTATAILDPTGLMGVQQSAGNQAVQRMLAGAAGQPVDGARPPVIHRLVYTSEQFRKNTDAGFLAGRGKTLKQIEKLLDEYHALCQGGKLPQSLPQIEKAIEILTHTKEDAELWLFNHEGDTSRSRHRTGGMKALINQIKNSDLKDLTAERDRRLAAMAQKGLDAKPKEMEPNHFKAKMQGDVSSCLSKMAPLIQAAAPNPGDSGELEVQLECPVDPSGTGYLGMRFTVSIEHLEKKAMKLRMELAVTGGAKIGNVAKIGGELGGYVEAQGEDAKKTLDLVSYGFYRRFRESYWIPNEVANFMWGGSATSVGWKRSEKWAAKVEKENFKKKQNLNSGPTGEDEEGAYVETGGLLGVGAEIGIKGVAKGEVGAQYTTGKHYDYDAFEKIGEVDERNKGKLGYKPRKKLGEEAPVPLGMRGRQRSLGESVHSLEITGAVEGGPFAGELTLGFNWSTEGREGSAKFQDFSAELSASASLPVNELVAKGIGGYIPPIVASLIEVVKKAVSKGTAEGGENAGHVISLGENAATSFTQLGKVPQEAFKPEFKFDMSEDPKLFEGSVALKLTGSINSNREGSIKLEYVKEIGVNAGIFSGKLTKGKRILEVVYKPSGDPTKPGAWRVL